MTGYEEALRHRVEKLEAELVAVRKENEELKKIVKLNGGKAAPVRL